MQFEGITLCGVISELNESVIGGYVQKIHQPTEQIVILQVYNREKFRLLISTGQHARIHLSTENYENPETPFGFCMLLRKHLTGARVSAIRQLRLERICDVELQTKSGHFILRAEFMGTQSNLFLLRENTILGAMHTKMGEKHFRPGQELERRDYQPKLNPFDFSDQALHSAIEKDRDENLQTALRLVLDGIGPQTARELIARSELEAGIEVSQLPKSEVEMLIDTTREFFNIISHRSQRACLYEGPDGNSECTLLPYLIYEDLEMHEMESLSACLDIIYSGTQQEPLLEQVNSASKEINNKIKRVERALKATRRDLERAQAYEKIKEKGDLLMAHLGEIEKGVSEVQLTGPDGQTRSISLDPRLSPVENAQAFYNRYKKLKRGVDKITTRVHELESELEELMSIKAELESVESVDEVEKLELAIELGDASLSESSSTPDSQPASGPRLLDYKGFRMWVGRNGKQNDALIRKAHRDDLWFHVKERPGSHVIIQTQRAQNVPTDVIERGAELAAFYSRAQNERKVAVMYTRVKHLKKPKGARPGQVLVSKEEGSVTVCPRGIQ